MAPGKKGAIRQNMALYLSLLLTQANCSVKTLHCFECNQHKNDDKNSEKYKQWYDNHAPSCTINYEGSAGAMECNAGVEMFLRSIETRHLRYTVFVGDGDSSCYAKVRDACFDKYGL